MKKTISILLLFAIVILTATSCKSKQKVTKITGANIPATSTVTTPSVTPTTTSSENELTRNEKFVLADGETNSEALNFKYHVVVGSFKNQTNAKGLQTTLKNEGNKSLVVINEQGMLRVLISSFNDYNEAKAKINQIKNRFPDSWVLVQK